MILTGYSLFEYMFNIPLIDVQKLLSGDYIVEENDNDSKNNNFILREKEKSIYFIKQSKKNDISDLIDAFIENKIFQVFTKNKIINDSIINIKYYDKENACLIFDFLNSINISDCIQAYINRGFVNSDGFNKIFEKLSIILAEYHIKSYNLQLIYDESFINYTPSILKIEKNFTLNGRIIKNIQEIDGLVLNRIFLNDFIFACIDELTEFYIKEIIEFYEDERYKSIIHNDIRGNNILTDDDTKISYLKIIDWELSCIGNRFWDVAQSIIIILDTITSIFSLPDELDILYKSLSDFWKGYLKYSEIENTTDLCRNIIKLVGIRKIDILLSNYSQLKVIDSKIENDYNNDLNFFMNHVRCPESIKYNDINLFKILF